MSLDLLAENYRQLNQLYEKMYVNTQNDQSETPEGENTNYTANTFIMSEQIWNDAMAVLESNQFYSISIVGPQGSGKTEIARTMAKYALLNDFKIVYALPDDFLPNVSSWLEKILVEPRAKNCLIIDDLSYTLEMQPRKTQALIKNLVARFRHVFGGQLLVIYITHRLHAAPPMLRNSGTWIFSAMQSADRDDASEIIGKNKEMRERLESLYNFIAKVSIEGAKNRIIKFTVGDKDISKSFVWGTKEHKGDGRLMACYHGGKLNVFCSKISDDPIDLEKYRFPKSNINSIFFDVKTPEEKNLVKEFE